MTEPLRETDNIEELHRKVDYVIEKLHSFETIIEKVAGEVMPTINALTESPMLKMLLPKVKK